MKNILTVLVLMLVIKAKAQVGIGTPTPDASAQLDVSSTSKGFLPPRMTFAQRNSIGTPSAGLIVWCTDCGTTGEMQVYDGTTWKAVSLVAATEPPLPPVNSSVVISQVYGGGSNTGATYNVDYVELFNKSTTTQSLSGLSIQYASVTGTSWNLGVLSTTASIPPGGYFLIQMGTPGTIGLSLPAPDASFNISMAAAGGKVALVNATTGLTGSCPSTNLLDFVGYGSAANCFEGAGPTPTPSATTAVFRNSNGCTDTNVNSADFTAGAPNPRNSSTPVSLCP